MLVAGCGGGAREAAEKRAQLAESRLTQMNAIAAEKDTLLSELMATTTFISQIGNELSKIKPLKRGTMVSFDERVMPMAEYRSAMLTRIRELGARLDSSDARLQASSARLRTLSANDREMTARIAQFEQTVAQYKSTIAEQRTQIEKLNSQVETLQTDMARLAAERDKLSAENLDLAESANTAYYIIGTKSQLLEMQVVQEKGGASGVLGIGGGGKTLVPAGELHEADFTALNKNTDFEITFPKANKSYQIVSPQNLKVVEPQPAKNGTFKGGIRIQDPKSFWAQSKFLIIVER